MRHLPVGRRIPAASRGPKSPRHTPRHDHTRHLPVGRLALHRDGDNSRCPRIVGIGIRKGVPPMHSVRMPTQPRALPDTIGAQFTAADALAAGVSRRRLRARDLVAPFHGVRRTASSIADQAEEDAADTEPYPLARRERRRVLNDARAYQLIQPQGSFICGRSAAVLYGAPVANTGALEVGTVAPRRAPRGKNVRGRKIAQHLIGTRVHEGLLLSDPASTWAMLCRDLTERELVQVGDWMVRSPRDRFGTPHPEQQLATLEQLRQAAAAGSRPPGTKRLRIAAESVRVGSSSVLETDFRLDAAAAGLPEPSLDVEIRIEGRLLGISEIVYKPYRLVVETEGDHHRTDRKQWHRDIAKYRAYEAAGMQVLRLTSFDLRGDRPDGIRLVAEALRRRGWTG